MASQSIVTNNLSSQCDAFSQEHKIQPSSSNVAIGKSSEDGNPGPWSMLTARGVKPDPESLMSVQDQMDMEVENSIKYRTCSWQRVWLALLSKLEALD